MKRPDQVAQTGTTNVADLLLAESRCDDTQMICCESAAIALVERKTIGIESFFWRLVAQALKSETRPRICTHRHQTIKANNIYSIVSELRRFSISPFPSLRAWQDENVATASDDQREGDEPASESSPQSSPTRSPMKQATSNLKKAFHAISGKGKGTTCGRCSRNL